MATPITVLDSANIAVTDNQYIVSITGSVVGQTDVDYLLSPKYSFTGSLVNPTPNGGDIAFGYGILVAPTVSPTSSLNYPLTSVTDFKFFLNGVRIDNEQVLTFTENFNNTQSTASFNLGYSLRDYDIVTGEGKFRV